MAGVQDAMTVAGVAFQMPGACRWCSGPFSVTVHSGPCPRVKAMDFYPDGTVKHVEFHGGDDTPCRGPSGVP